MKLQKYCARCGTEVDLLDVTWWQGVKGPEHMFDSSIGDLCDPCHKVWITERPPGQPA